MNITIMDSIGGLADFAVYFGSALAYLALFCKIYCLVTPYDELKMVREGKTAPAISFGGAVIGFVLPLASAISHSISLIDMLVWAMIAMVVQLTIFSCVRLIFRDLVRDIEENKSAAAILLAFFSIAVGILNSASMTY